MLFPEFVVHRHEGMQFVCQMLYILPSGKHNFHRQYTWTELRIILGLQYTERTHLSLFCVWKRGIQRWAVVSHVGPACPMTIRRSQKTISEMRWRKESSALLWYCPKARGLLPCLLVPSSSFLPFRSQWLSWESRLWRVRDCQDVQLPAKTDHHGAEPQARGSVYPHCFICVLCFCHALLENWGGCWGPAHTKQVCSVFALPSLSHCRWAPSFPWGCVFCGDLGAN